MDAAIRDVVRNRAAGRCEYCRLPDLVQLLPFHVEHIIAKQHGGSGELDNLAWSCDRCNAYKGPNLSSIDPLSGQLVALFHPRHDRWIDHFAVAQGEIQGITPAGRASVRLLQLNSRHRIQLRIELTELGLFDWRPPGTSILS